ncbi:hypothetical protein PL373_13785 [Tenacibaculum maritimum]|nr:hypothetical protein [Tenacibaculum maritimum]
MVKQTDFSQYYMLNSKPFIKRKEIEDRIEHPFIFIEDYINNLDSIPTLGVFDKALTIFNNIKSFQKYAYNCFELELSLLKENRIKYLNQVVSKLLEIQKSLRHTKRKQILERITSIESLFLLLLNSVKDILKSIFISCHLELNNTNREVLSKWFYLKKAVTSFRFNKYPEDKRLENLYHKYFINERLISPLVKFSTFKSLFEGRQLENKINWIDRKSSLYYFVKLLIESNIIKNPKNKHWEITSEFFLLKGESLLSRDFLNQKETQNKKTRKTIESFIQALS